MVVTQCWVHKVSEECHRGNAPLSPYGSIEKRKHRMTRNLLDQEASPYLLQHKDNPVHWHSWNTDTLALAKKENKPILLSVGYAACHWCHVMAHESFEDDAIAGLMNGLFINIKVDREERPDIDAIYQSALQMMGDQGP